MWKQISIFLLEKKFFLHGFNLAEQQIIKFYSDLIWRSEKKIKFDDFRHFAPIAPNFPLRQNLSE